MADEPSWEDIFLPKAEPTEPAKPTVPAPTPTQQPQAPPAWQQPTWPQAPASQQTPAQQPPAWPPPVAPQAAPTQYPPTQVYPAQSPVPQSPPQAAPAQAAPTQYPPTQYPPTQAYPAQPAAPQYPPAPAQPSAPAPHPAAAPADPFAALFAGTSETPTQIAPAEPPFQAQPPMVPPVVAPVARPTAADSAPGSSDDPFAGLFAAGHVAAVPASGSGGMTRRELREGSGGGGGRGRGGDDFGGGYGKPRKKRRLLWLKITLPIVLVLGAAGGVGAYGWFNYNDQVRELLGIPLPTDYEGSGNGEEVIVTIRSGDIGSDVANTLHTSGVTMTFDAVYDYLVEHPEIGFLPGNWALQGEMSAESAVDALQDPANKVTSKLLIIEGSVLPDVLEIIASTTGIDLADVQAAAADPAVYGVPAEAPSLEGYLFPATYELDGTETAESIITMLVDETFARLDTAGVAPESRHAVLTMAALIQREAGSNPDDFYKVSRVFQNRIDQGILLESDATVAYGTGNLHTVWTTDAERADATNPYNTYVHPGLPVGPIGAAGDRAIDAALNPAEGSWLFFVPVNLATGETVFSETVEEHEAAVEQLFAWCEASDENASYCE